MSRSTSRTACIAAITFALLAASPMPALAQEPTYQFNIPAQDLGTALRTFGQASRQQIIYDQGQVRGKQSAALAGTYDAEEGLSILLGGTGLRFERSAAGVLVVRSVTAKLGVDDTAEAAPPPAQPAADERPVDKVTVTGSRIRGNTNGAAPVQVYDRDDIDQTGFATLNQFMQTVPQNFGGDVNENAAQALAAPGGSFTLGSAANLRGLGSGSTLTLLNGHRLAPDGYGEFVDISGFPVSAIQRVEVLTDGASAIYGSDAVAGVVNVIMRDDYDGAETRLRYGAADGFAERQAGQTFGTTWIGGNALLAYEYYDRDALRSRDRDYTSAGGSDVYLLPSLERHSVFGSVSQALSDDVELFGFGTYSTRDGENQSLSFFDEVTLEHAGGTGGAKFDLGSWRAEVSASYHQSQVSDKIAFGGTPFGEARNESSVTAGDAQADGPIIRLPGGDVRAAVGAHFRTETFQTFFDGIPGAPEASRDIWAAFAEVLVPFVGADNRRPGIERLELTLAGRTEHYSDFGQTTNPKVGLVWFPVENWKLRGTYGTSFKAPTFDNLNERPVDATIFTAYPDPLPGTGMTTTFVLYGGNRDLQPEEAATWTIGTDFTLEAWGGVRGRLTYFDIDYTNRIGLPGGVIEGLIHEAEFGSLTVRNPSLAFLAAQLAAHPAADDFCGCTIADVGAFVDGRLHNLSAERLSGLDFGLARDFAFDEASLSLAVDGQYLFALERQGTPTSPVVEKANTVFNPPTLRLRGTASLHAGGWTGTLGLNFTNSYDDDRFSPAAGIDAWTTVDLFVAYDTAGIVQSGLLKDTKFSISAVNLFDTDPPFAHDVANEINFDGANANALGRLVAFQITKSY